MTPPTVGRKGYGLEVLGLEGGPLYVTKPDLPNFIPGFQAVDLGRIDEALRMQPAGKAFVTKDEGPRAVFRPGLEEGLGYWSAPVTVVKGLVLGLSYDLVSLEEVAAP